MLSDLCRFYPGYTLERAAEELDTEQLHMLLRRAYERPWDYAALVEPKKR